MTGAEVIFMERSRWGQGRRPRLTRRSAVLGGAAAGACLLVAAVAWACTPHAGVIWFCGSGNTGCTQSNQVTSFQSGSTAWVNGNGLQFKDEAYSLLYIEATPVTSVCGGGAPFTDTAGDPVTVTPTGLDSSFGPAEVVMPSVPNSTWEACALLVRAGSPPGAFASNHAAFATTGLP